MPTNASNTDAPPRDGQMPSLPRQVWNLATSLADFVVDRCRTVTEDEYRQRLEVCDACEERRDNRCTKCGCYLSLKARGRAFRCPLDKWPPLTEAPGE